MVAGAPELQSDPEAENENGADDEADERQFHGVVADGSPRRKGVPYSGPPPSQ